MKKLLIATALVTLAACSGKKTEAAPAASDSSMMSRDSSTMMPHDSTAK